MASGSAPPCGPRPEGPTSIVGIYFWNGGSPELMLFVRDNGNWASWRQRPRRARWQPGTTLSLSATGPTLTFAENGTTAITATDTTLTGGAPASWPTACPRRPTGRAPA